MGSNTHTFIQKLFTIMNLTLVSYFLLILAPTKAETIHPRIIGSGCFKNINDKIQPRKNTNDAKTNLMRLPFHVWVDEILFERNNDYVISSTILLDNVFYFSLTTIIKIYLLSYPSRFFAIFAQHTIYCFIYN